MADFGPDLGEAFRSYQQKRKARVEGAAAEVRENARIFRIADPIRRVGVVLGRWAMSKLRPTGVQERFASRYAYDAPRA
jgi:hypothetical protein